MAPASHSPVPVRPGMLIPMAVVGVDACKGGWIAVCLSAKGITGGVFVSTLEELSQAVPNAQGFAVDIPIGVPEDEPRSADL